LQAVIMGACPTIDCCAKVESPMLGVLAQAYPAVTDRAGRKVESACIIWMRAQFTEVSAFANVKEKMNDWQLDNLSMQILAEFPTLTMMEFILFCARLRSGIYEEFYGNVDPMRIMKSFRSFVKDRQQDYWRKYEEDRKAKEEREAEEARKNKVTWEEYCKMNGIEGRPHPFDRIAEEFKKQEEEKAKAKVKKENPNEILRQAKWLVTETFESIRETYSKIFEKKHGCTPQEYIDAHNDVSG